MELVGAQRPTLYQVPNAVTSGEKRVRNLHVIPSQYSNIARDKRTVETCIICPLHENSTNRQLSRRLPISNMAVTCPRASQPTTLFNVNTGTATAICQLAWLAFSCAACTRRSATVTHLRKSSKVRLLSLNGLNICFHRCIAFVKYPMLSCARAERDAEHLA